MKVERLEQEVKDQKGLSEESDKHYARIFEEKVTDIDILREENRQLNQQVHNLQIKSYDKKKTLQKLYLVVTEKDQ